MTRPCKWSYDYRCGPMFVCIHTDERQIRACCISMHQWTRTCTHTHHTYVCTEAHVHTHTLQGVHKSTVGLHAYCVHIILPHRQKSRFFTAFWSKWMMLCSSIASKMFLKQKIMQLTPWLESLAIPFVGLQYGRPRTDFQNIPQFRSIVKVLEDHRWLVQPRTHCYDLHVSQTTLLLLLLLLLDPIPVESFGVHVWETEGNVSQWSITPQSFIASWLGEISATEMRQIYLKVIL